MIEFVCVIAIFLSFVFISAYSTLSEIKAEKKGTNWSFHVPEASARATMNPVEESYKFTKNTPNSTNNEVQLSDYTDVYLNAKSELLENFEATSIIPTMNVSEFEHSTVSQDTMQSISELIKTVNSELEAGNVSTLSENIIDYIETIVGPRVSKLVTNSYSTLKENTEAVVMGLYCPESNTLSFMDEVLNLTGSELIVSGEEDQVLIKGMLLPSSEFRVLHHEDADTVECGYGMEQFLLRNIA